MTEDFPLCPKCGRYLKKDVVICPHCKHDQRKPLQKGTTDVGEFAKGMWVFGFTAAENDARGIAKHENNSFWVKKAAVLSVRKELLINYFAIEYILCCKHFRHHPQLDEIRQYFSAVVATCWETFYRNEKEALNREMKIRVEEYNHCYDANEVEWELTKLFKAHMEAAARNTPFIGVDWGVPSADSMTFYSELASSFMNQFVLFLDRWDIVTKGL